MVNLQIYNIKNLQFTFTCKLEFNDLQLWQSYKKPQEATFLSHSVYTEVQPSKISWFPLSIQKR